jgi:hypothetical protein
MRPISPSGAVIGRQTASRSAVGEHCIGNARRLYGFANRMNANDGSPV